MQGRHIRFGTDLITFFHGGHWDLDPSTGHEGFIRAFEAEPRRFFDRMLDLSAQAGLQGIELAPHPAGWAAARNVYGSASGFARALQERGLTLVSSYAPGGPAIGQVLGDESSEGAAIGDAAEHARFIVECGARYITQGSVPRSKFVESSADDVPREVLDRVAEVLNALGSAVAIEGAALALHTDAFSVCARPEDISYLLEATDPDSILLCPDSGHIVLDGHDPVDVLEQHLPRIPYMHWKDGCGRLDPDGLVGSERERHEVMLKYFRLLGEGVIDWPAWMRVLQGASWSGWALAELDMSPDPVAELRRGLATFQRDLAPIYS